MHGSMRDSTAGVQCTISILCLYFQMEDIIPKLYRSITGIQLHDSIEGHSQKIVSIDITLHYITLQLQLQRC